MDTKYSPVMGYLDGMGRVNAAVDHGLPVLFWVFVAVVTIAALAIIRGRRDP